jgi:hypothetical protein
MNYALIIFVFSLMMPQQPEFAGDGPFATLEECQTAAAEIPKVIERHNASDNPVKVHYFAAECVPLKQAPRGKPV